jgi:hypothetical protein
MVSSTQREHSAHKAVSSTPPRASLKGAQTLVNDCNNTWAPFEVDRGTTTEGGSACWRTCWFESQGQRIRHPKSLMGVSLSGIDPEELGEALLGGRARA